MLSSGIAYDVVADGMDHVIEGNIAMRGELSKTSALFGTVMNNFSDQFDRFPSDAEKMEHLADVFAYSTKKYQMTGPLISEAFSYAVSPMKEWGMAVEEGLAIIGLLHNAGIRGSMAGTAMLATHRQLFKAEKELGVEFKRNADGSYEFSNVLEALHEKYGDNIADNDELKRKLQEAFGDEGKKAIIALWGMEDALRGDSKAMKETVGVARDMAQAFEEASGAKLERLSDQWRVFTASLTKESDVVDWAVESLTDLVGALDDMPDWAKELAATGMAVGGVAGSVAGPVMMGAGTLMQYRMAKGIKGLAGAGGLGGAMPVYETNPAAMEAGGIGGKAGAAGAAGAAGKKGVGVNILGIAPWVTLGVYAMTAKPGEGILMGEEEKAALAAGKEARERHTTAEGKVDWEAIIAESPGGGKIPKRFSWFEDPNVLGPPKEVSKTENFNININTINTQATDGAELAGELKKQARRTGKRKSP